MRSSLRGPQQNLVSGFGDSLGSAAGRSALRRWGSSCWRTGFATFGFGGAGGGEQIFFYDPDGNIVEVHQVQE